jgi:hypothetical protein
MIAMKNVLIAVFLIPMSDNPASTQELIKFPVAVASKVLSSGHLWGA